jgi:lipopolysaccharide transport system permease protein
MIERRRHLVIEPNRRAVHYWRELWVYRDLLYFMVLRDISVRYKQTMIGIAWVVIRPALIMLVFVGFRRVMNIPGSSAPEPILVFAAVLPWQFFSTALLEASSSLINNSNLVSKIYFPRIIIPLSSVMTACIDFAVTLALLALLMGWYGYAPTWRILFLPGLTVLTMTLALGSGMLLAALNIEYRDFRYIVPFIVQFGLFVSPIAFRTADVPATWRAIYALNPIVGIIEGFRWAILHDGAAVDRNALAISVAVNAGLLMFGLWYFRRAERGFADVI